jgi:hypothetical protein
VKETSFKRYFVKVPRTPPFNLPFPAQPVFCLPSQSTFLTSNLLYFFRFPHLPRPLTSFLRIPFKNFLLYSFFLSFLPSSYTSIVYPCCPYVPTFPTFLPLPLQLLFVRYPTHLSSYVSFFISAFGEQLVRIEYSLYHVCPSSSNNSALAVRIFVKFSVNDVLFTKICHGNLLQFKIKQK